MKPETIISRRNALFGGTAAGLVLLSKVAGAHDAPLIRKFGKARWARNIDNAVVYRNNSEFASHPYTRGFWETPGGPGRLVSGACQAGRHDEGGGAWTTSRRP